MEGKYVKTVLTVIALCLVWLSIKDFVVTKVVTKTQLEAFLEVSDPSYTKRKDEGKKVDLGENYFFRMPVRGSVEVSEVWYSEPFEVKGPGYDDDEPVRVVVVGDER